MVSECGTKRAVTSRRPRPPLDGQTLEALALAYVGRFATTRAKLARYLDRKLRERGWAGSAPAPVEAIVERCARSGYVDDAAFALSKARSLTGRGYGYGRVRAALAGAGVDSDDGLPARQLARQESVESALRLARRKRVGPFALAPLEREARDKAIAAMVRAGHGFALARAIVTSEPGADPDLDVLADIAGRHAD